MVHTTRARLESLARPLSGRLALVTGASRGIGRAIAIALAEAGADVAINYQQSKAGAAETLDAALQTGVSAGAFQANVGDFHEVCAMRDEIHRTMRPIDILVNNAGINRDKTFRRMEPLEWDEVIRTNLSGVFNVTRAFVEDLVVSRRGRIINVSSIVGERGNFGQANYAAAKAGILGLTKALAMELARDGVTANAIAPGFIATDMVLGMPDRAKERTLGQIPLGRFGNAEEVAGLAVYLASDAAAYVTGATLRLNGGQYV
jgi:3-oxoacyl-[acyl-carrier protein] reductase